MIARSTGRPGIRSDIARRKTGRASERLHQKRRVMSISSGLSSSSRATTFSSRAMPHFGQVPGSARTTSGCMGQTYSVRVAGASSTSGSRAMPHLGQAAGEASRISGSIGQMYAAPSTAVAGAACGAAADARTWTGSARNFSRQCLLQKK
jgi:hypothetical protein